MTLFPTRRRTGFHAGDDLQAGVAVRLDGVRSEALETGRSRMVATALVFLVVFGVIGLRLIDVALFDHTPARPSSGAKARGDGLDIDRADITDRNGVLLASSLPTVSLFARPDDVRAARVDVVAAATQLARILPDLEVADTAEALGSARQFVYLRRNLTPRQHQDVNALGIPGLQFETGEIRIYPHGNLLAHVVGLTDIDNIGIAGIEKRFDSVLRERRDPLMLSVDIRVQTIVRDELIRAIREFSAIGATGMVMDVRTGELLAMVSLPDFDPNDPPPTTDSALFNRATKGAYEMGSTFKLFNTAAALDSGRITMASSFDATKPLVFAGHIIHDDHALNRWLTVPEILVHSSNIGSARMALEIGTEAQRAFMARVGMLAPPAVELPEVGAPLVPSPWREINTVTISFGHGLSVTPLQLLAGVAALVNGGTYHTPTLLARVPGETVAGVQVVRPKVSAQIAQLMRMVVTEGTGKKADVPGYEVGGKTGTAEKVGHGGYRRKAVLASFVAAFPIDAPRYAVLMMIDEPQATRETYGFIAAGWTAAPVVGRVIAQVAPLLGLMPKPPASATPPQPVAERGRGGHTSVDHPQTGGHDLAEIN